MSVLNQNKHTPPRKVNFIVIFNYQREKSLHVVYDSQLKNKLGIIYVNLAIFIANLLVRNNSIAFLAAYKEKFQSMLFPLMAIYFTRQVYYFLIRYFIFKINRKIRSEESVESHFSDHFTVVDEIV